MNKENKNIFEYNSGIFLSTGKRKGNRYYKKDKEGHYFIPEIKSLSFGGECTYPLEVWNGDTVIKIKSKKR
jgi:hypothetical protein